MWIIFTDDPFFKGKTLYYAGDGAFNFDKSKAQRFETWEKTEKEMDYIKTNFELEVRVDKVEE